MYLRFLILVVLLIQIQEGLVESFSSPFKVNLEDILFINHADGTSQDHLLGEEIYLDKRSKGLEEFIPVRNEITQSQIQYYSFNVNTSSGLGQYYEFLVFLSGNICSQPDSLNGTDPNLVMYYSFNSEMFSNLALGEMSKFQYGYVEALADVPVVDENKSNDTTLYIAVQAPESTNSTDSWTYEFGVSQNGLIFQWDDRTWAHLVDADDSSALIVTGSLTSGGNDSYSELNASDSRYSLFIYPRMFKDDFDALNNSWCAIKNGQSPPTSLETVVSYTNRSGSLQQQFYVSGLNSSTKYVAYLVSDLQVDGFGGVVYQPFDFETMEEGVCSLVYELEFCTNVAYAVPTSGNLSYEELKNSFDYYTSSLYENFTKALQQIPCETENDAIFSPIRTCEDCSVAYKNWLCSVTIPRCTTRNNTAYIRRELNGSRNSFINDEIQPVSSYYEILPCIDMCNTLVRDCPSDFGFICPKHNETIKQSYYWSPTCNYVGIKPTSSSSRSFAFSKSLLLIVAFTYILLT